MRIAVIGSGVIGAKLVNKLCEMGHEAAASPVVGVEQTHSEDLRRALMTAHVVVDVANSPSPGERHVGQFGTRTQDLIAAEKAAGVVHHVALCLGGVDHFPENDHYGAQVQRLIHESQIPYTILRSTQLFEFIGDIATLLSNGRTVRATSTHIQPIGSDDVVTTLAEIAVGKPMNGIVEIAGPQQFHLDDLLRHLMQATGDLRAVSTDRTSHYVGALQQRTLTPERPNIIGTTHFTDWVAYSAGYAPMPRPYP